MKQIILLRHGQSQWVFEVDDRCNVLNQYYL